MGGNTTIITREGDSVSAQRIPLKNIGRDVFVKSFQKFLLNMNKAFKKEFKYPIWSDESEIMNGGIFNGSTSFIMDSNYDSNEIEKYKPNAGDLDVAVPREYGSDIYRFLEKHEGEEFSDNIRYIGNNAKSADKLGNTLICISKAKFGDIVVFAQLDLELSDFDDSDEIKGYIENGKIYDSNKKFIAFASQVEIIKGLVEGDQVILNPIIK